MFDIGFWELCLIGVVALVVVGPERLPRVARTLGLWAGRARRFMSEVKADIDAELRQEEFKALREVREDLKQAKTDFTKAGSEFQRSVAEAEAQHAGAKEPTPETAQDTASEGQDKPKSAAADQ